MVFLPICIQTVARVLKVSWSISFVTCMVCRRLSPRHIIPKEMGSNPNSVDFLLGRVQEVEGRAVCDWVQRRLQVALEGARERMQAAAQRRKGHHNLLGQLEPLQVGQQVYLRHYSEQGCNKIRNAWSTVVCKLENPNSERGQEQEEVDLGQWIVVRVPSSSI
ncbi:hypothetical protein SRHO_G00104250 [Serrasalmus rhombeus]